MLSYSFSSWSDLILLIWDQVCQSFEIFLLNIMLFHELSSCLFGIWVNRCHYNFFLTTNIDIDLEGVQQWASWRIMRSRIKSSLSWREAISFRSMKRFIFSISIGLESIFLLLLQVSCLISAQVSFVVLVFFMVIHIQIVPLVGIVLLLLSVSSSQWTLSIFQWRDLGLEWSFWLELRLVLGFNLVFFVVGVLLSQCKLFFDLWVCADLERFSFFVGQHLIFLWDHWLKLVLFF